MKKDVMRTYIGRLGMIFICVYGMVCGMEMHACHGDFKWRVEDATMMSKVEIPQSSSAVALEILWRLPFEMEKDTSSATVRVFSVEHDMEITNLYVREMTRERLTLAFEPLGSGEYEVYYSPVKHAPAESPCEWVEKYGLHDYPKFSILPKFRSSHVKFRYRPQDNPYDRMATDIRMQMYCSASEKTFEAYFMPWYHPLSDASLLPEVWAASVLDAPKSRRGKKSAVMPDTLTVERGGVIPVQIGVVGVKDMQDVTVSYSVPSRGMTLRPIGDTVISLSRCDVRALWSVLEVQDDVREGHYYMNVLMYSSLGDEKQMPVLINVISPQEGEKNDYVTDFVGRVGKITPAADVFDRDLAEGMSAVSFEVPYVHVGKHTLCMDGRTGLISSMKCAGREILDSPVLLVFSSANGTRKISVNQVSVRHSGASSVRWNGMAATHDMNVEVSVRVSPYGRVDIRAQVKFLENIDFKNISLEFDFASVLSKAGYGHVSVDENGVYDMKVKDSDDGIWVTGDDVGVCISVPDDKDNAFFSMQRSRMSLYKGSDVGVAVSTGDFKGEKDKGINMECRLQILPVGGCPRWDGGKAVMVMCDGELPPADADVLLVEGAHGVYDECGEARMREWHTDGKEVLLYMNGYVLPSDGVLSRILASMGYGYGYESGEKYMRFDAHEDLRGAFRALQLDMCDRGYVSGVLFSPRWYRRADVDAYGRAVNPEKRRFRMVMNVEGMGMDVLMAAPWAEALWGEDETLLETVKDITGLPIMEGDNVKTNEM